MTIENNLQKTETSSLKLVSFVIPYLLVISSLYLYSYWSTLGINIFEYISVSDIIKISIKPAIMLSFFLSLVYFWGVTLLTLGEI